MDSKPITFWSIADYMDWNGIHLNVEETFNAIIDIASITEYKHIPVQGDEVPQFVLDDYFGGRDDQRMD